MSHLRTPNINSSQGSLPCYSPTTLRPSAYPVIEGSFKHTQNSVELKVLPLVDIPSMQTN